MSERELRRIFLLASLMREFYGPDELASWFYAPQSLLDGRRPIDMTGDDSEWSKILAMVERLRNGSYL